VEFAVRLLNVGVDGFCRWSFVNRGDVDGQWQLVDTWDEEHERLRASFTPHPSSYALWGMLTGNIGGGKLVEWGAAVPFGLGFLSCIGSLLCGVGLYRIYRETDLPPERSP
ncbi:MAG: hypothetical protein QGI83_20925, partial [Candidatus Latescibacteria bacterium]|nr:hypothetical protein [Candidatus Latescibacterota bacterium]